MKRPASVSGCFLALGRAQGHTRALLRLLAWVTFAVLHPAANVHAASFTVNPVRIVLSAAMPSAVLQVENTQPLPVTIQLSTMAWAQPDGKDELRPSRDILATPQIFTLKPGATQIVRIGLLRKIDAEQEASYRVLLDEIPPPPAPDFRGLQVALRISLPVFIQPAGEASPCIVASVRSGDEKQLRLALTNLGKAAAQLQGLTVHPNREPLQILAAHPSAVYVLPGQTRELSFKMPETEREEHLLIKALMYGKPIELHASPSVQ